MSEKTEAMTADQFDAIGNRLHSVSFGEWIKGFNIQLQCSTLSCDGQNIFWAVHPDTMKSDRALEFIAHARQDMRELLAEVSRLRAENRCLEMEADKLSDFLSCYPDARCPVDIEGIDFSCPHGRRWDDDGCIPFEDACWRAAARKETRKDEGND